MTNADLSAAIRARLDELGLTIAEWKRRSGVSDVTLRGMREGKRYSVAKERAAERALGWAAGSVEAAASGEMPTVAAVVTSEGKAITGLTDAEGARLESTLAALRRERPSK